MPQPASPVPLHVLLLLWGLLIVPAARGQLLCDDPVAVLSTPSDAYSYAEPVYTAPDDVESVTVTGYAVWDDDWSTPTGTTTSGPLLVQVPYAGGQGCDNIYDHPENHYASLGLRPWLPDDSRQGSLVIGPGDTVHVAGSDCGLRDNFHGHQRVEICVEEHVAPSSEPENGCNVDDFSDLDPAWQLTDLGDASAGAATVVDGELHLSGNGSSLYHDDDNAAFLHRPLMGDFRIEVEITGVPVDAGGTYRKGGLMVRAGNAADAPRVMIQYMPHFPPDRPALQFDYRGLDGVADELSSTVPDVTLPVRVAIQRRGHEVSVFYSTDGWTWIQPLGGVGGVVDLAMGSEVDAGLAVASYDPDPATFAFDDFTVCAVRGHGPVPTDLPCSDGPRDIVYLLDSSDSMRRAHGDPVDGISKFEAARDALLAINTGLAQQDDGSRAALITFHGVEVHIESDLTDDFEHLAELLSTIERPVLVPYQPNAPTPSPLSLEAARYILDSRASDRPVVVIWPTDGIPTMDQRGRGPYDEDAVAEIRLGDGMDGFLPSAAVAELGDFVPATSTFVGRPVADTMVALEDLRDSQGDLRILSLVPRGSVENPTNLPVLPEDLLDYAAYYTQGSVFGAVDPAGLTAQAPALLHELSCGAAGLAGISGKLWRDDDLDGIHDEGEPLLAGVTLSVGASSVITDDQGHYAFRGLVAGSHTVTVEPADLPLDVDLPTFDADGVATAHQATVTVPAWNQVSADFGYGRRDGASVVGCSEDEFDILDPAWTLSELGDANQGAATSVLGELHLTGDGTSLYAGADHGAFLHRRVAGNFRMEVDVTGFPVDAGGAYRKAGLMARAGLHPDDARVILQYVPDFGGSARPVLQFRYRATAGGPGDVALGSNLYDVPLPVRLALEHADGVWSVSFSQDGGNTWISPAGGTGGSVELDLGQAPYVGPNVVSYSADTALTASFDDLSLCGPGPCEPGEPLDTLVSGIDAVGLALGPDGRLYAGHRLSGDVMRFDAEDGTALGQVATVDEPMGLTFGSDGHLYVADGSLGEVHRLDPATGASEVFADGLTRPWHLVFGPSGDLYVGDSDADGTGGAVRRFDGDTGAFVETFAQHSDVDGPRGLFFHEEYLYVASDRGNSVSRFDAGTGDYVDTFISNGQGGLADPNDMVLGPDRRIYISSENSREILIFELDGTAVSEPFADADAGISAPDGLEFGTDGSLYVANRGTDEVLRFSGDLCR